MIGRNGWSRFIGTPGRNDNKERAVTIHEGSNRLAKLEALDTELEKVLAGPQQGRETI